MKEDQAVHVIELLQSAARFERERERERESERERERERERGRKWYEKSVTTILLFWQTVVGQTLLCERLHCNIADLVGPLFHP